MRGPQSALLTLLLVLLADPTAAQTTYTPRSGLEIRLQLRGEEQWREGRLLALSDTAAIVQLRQLIEGSRYGRTRMVQDTISVGELRAMEVSTCRRGDGNRVMGFLAGAGVGTGIAILIAYSMDSFPFLVYAPPVFALVGGAIGGHLAGVCAPPHWVPIWTPPAAG